MRRHLTVGNRGTRRLDLDTPLPVVEKDILRVGTWHLSDDSTWRVTPDTLRRIAGNFARSRAAGNRVPWIVNHDGGAANRIGDVVRLEVRGDTLVARLAVTDRRYAADFGEPGDTSEHEVSVEVQEPWADGTGQRYPIALTHVANVLNPVVTRQGPAIRVLALSSSPPARSRNPVRARLERIAAAKRAHPKLGRFIRKPQRAVARPQTSVTDDSDSSVQETNQMALSNLKRLAIEAKRQRFTRQLAVGDLNDTGTTMPVTEVVDMVNLLLLGCEIDIVALDKNLTAGQLRAQWDIIRRAAEAYVEMQAEAREEQERQSADIGIGYPVSGGDPYALSNSAGSKAKRLAIQQAQERARKIFRTG